jgi:hypothetical protein
MRKIFLMMTIILFAGFIISCHKEGSSVKQLEILNFEFKKTYTINEEVSLEKVLFRVIYQHETTIYTIFEQQVHIDGHVLNLDTFMLDTSRSGHYKLTFSIDHVYITFNFEVLDVTHFIIDDMDEIHDLIENVQSHVIIYLNQPVYHLSSFFEIEQGLTLKPAKHLENVTFNCVEGCFIIRGLNENEEVHLQNLTLNNDSLVQPAIEIDGEQGSAFHKLSFTNMDIKSAFGIQTKEHSSLGFSLEVESVIFDGLNKTGIAIKIETTALSNQYSMILKNNIFKNFNRSSKNVVVQSDHLKEIMITHNTFLGKTRNIPYTALDLMLSNGFEGELVIQNNVFLNDYVYHICLFSDQTLNAVFINFNNFLTTNDSVIHLWNRSIENNNLSASNNYFSLNPHIKGYHVFLEPISETLFIDAGSKRFLDE